MQKTENGYECAKHGAPTLTSSEMGLYKSQEVVTFAKKRRISGRGRLSKENPTTERSNLTAALNSKIIALHNEGRSIWFIAGEIWEEAGYLTRHSCKSSILRMLRAAGVDTSGNRIKKEEP